jgi:hypothetical protein
MKRYLFSTTDLFCWPELLSMGGIDTCYQFPFRASISFPAAEPSTLPCSCIPFLFLQHHGTPRSSSLHMLAALLQTGVCFPIVIHFDDVDLQHVRIGIVGGDEVAEYDTVVVDVLSWSWTMVSS